MLPKVAASQRATESFLRETVNTQALQHPNVVRLWEAGCSQGTFFFTLEFCEGGSVDKLMARRGGKLSIDEARPIILQALDGLHYAHHAEIPHVKLKDGSIGQGRGLVHRDLKPQNIFLSTAGGSRVAKLGDYGLAKAFDMAGLSGHTCTGEVGRDAAVHAAAAGAAVQGGAAGSGRLGHGRHALQHADRLLSAGLPRGPRSLAAHPRNRCRPHPPARSGDPLQAGQGDRPCPGG